MTFRHILVPAFSLADDEAAISAGDAIAVRFDAKPTALIVALPLASAHADSAAPLSEVLADLVAEQSVIHQERARIVARLEQAGVPFEICDLSVLQAIADREAVAHARLTDLVVMARADETRRAHRALLECLLFHSGRPVLLVPGSWKPRTPGERILVAWKPRREAVRAIHDAMPFLKSAKRVVAVTVDAVPSPSGYGEAPGADLAVLMERHGVGIEVRNVDGLGRTEGHALLDEAAAMDADMIVMGAYGRSRAEEMLFGGVTRELLAHAPIPLFLSH